MKEKETKIEESGSGEKFYNAMDDVEERSVNEHVPAPEVLAAPAVTVPEAPVAQTSAQPKGKTKLTGVDPSGNLPDTVLVHLQAEMDRAVKTNIRFHELYQQLKTKPPTSPKP
ncbi:hypothetical protein Dimus_029081 [Dionaea muscipula]